MSELKDTNPKDAVGIDKVSISCVPLNVLLEVALAMQEGALKYGRHNYRAVGVRASVYVDATFRHLAAWWEGEDKDPDSGLPHLIKAIACLVVVSDARARHQLNDDRPPASPKDMISFLNSQAKSLNERYPDPKPAVTKRGIPVDMATALGVASQPEVAAKNNPFPPSAPTPPSRSEVAQKAIKDLEEKARLARLSNLASGDPMEGDAD